jgi:hypothetical protein
MALSFLVNASVWEVISENIRRGRVSRCWTGWVRLSADYSTARLVNRMEPARFTSWARRRAQLFIPPWCFFIWACFDMLKIPSALFFERAFYAAGD